MAHGVGRHAISRLLSTGQWHVVVRGVYALAPSPTWMTLAWAGVLVVGDEGALGAEAALHLHGVAERPRTITVWTGGRQIQNRGPWVFVEGTRTRRGAPARVPIEDATLEVCGLGDRDHVLATLAAVVTSRRTTTDRLRVRAEELMNLRNRALVLEMLSDVVLGAESPLESRYLRDVEYAHALPTGARQVSISDGTRSDVAYVEHGVLVELDGRLGHTGSGAFRDFRRDNRHTIAGFVTLRFGWGDVAGSPCAVAEQVATVLTAHGWPGTTRRCRRCRS